MANDEHVALLKQGVAAWNAWRDKDPNIRPDLTGAKLTEARLNGANLGRAMLEVADLHCAVLEVANLSGANLAGADLSEASLTAAHLDPDMHEVYDRAADLADRILRGARPGDLPFEQPTRFRLVINKKTMEALGLTIPPAMLMRADDVVD